MSSVIPGQIPGEVVVEMDSAGACRHTAARMARTIKEAIVARGRAAIGLSGGNTPRDAYAALAREPGIDWSKVDVFWVDERAAAPTDDRSNYHWVKATLLDGAKVPPERVHRMPADAPDLAGAARGYEKLVLDRVDRDAEGVPLFDLLVLGVGDDGHTASLFPGETTVDITDRFVVAAPAAPGREARMTLTTPVIQHARHALVLIAGAGKKPALERLAAPQGDLHETPSRILRNARGQLTFVLDAAVAGKA
jgi:6-phosphogluconolactonase